MSRKQRHRYETPTLDLNRVHFESTKHGIHILGTWGHKIVPGKKWEPCLALLHAGRQINDQNTIAVVIPLNEAWRWALHGDVGDPAHCVASICDWFCDGLLPGDPANKADYTRVMDAINSRLPDLIAMPPRPKGDTEVIGEARRLDAKTGLVIEEREIRIDV